MAPESLRYSILGSCVTEDAVVRGFLPEPVNYFSRSRIQSIVSTPSPIDRADITIDNEFQQRVIVQDFDKTPARTLASLDHPLVVDLGDERNPLMHTGSGIVTATMHFTRLRLGDRSGMRTIKSDRELKDDGPFAEACHFFANRFVPDQRVLLHIGYMATHDADGKQVEQWRMANRFNAWLERAYEIFSKALGSRITQVTPNPDYRVPDPTSKWGIKPYHFPKEYHEDLARLIRQELQPAAVA